jgi:hypothetical protein
MPNCSIVGCKVSDFRRNEVRAEQKVSVKFRDPECIILFEPNSLGGGIL